MPLSCLHAVALGRLIFVTCSLWLSNMRGLWVRNKGMKNPSLDTADAPLLFAVRYLIREYRNCIASLQFMLDENRDLFVPLPNDHPVALGIPLPHSLLAPHRQFCDAVRAAIATIESLVESMEAWADDIERTIRDAVRQTRRMLQNRSHPY